VVTAERDGRDGVLRVAANGGEEVEGTPGTQKSKAKAKSLAPTVSHSGRAHYTFVSLVGGRVGVTVVWQQHVYDLGTGGFPCCARLEQSRHVDKRLSVDVCPTSKHTEKPSSTSGISLRLPSAKHTQCHY
jgi:hypothetical protein